MIQNTQFSHQVIQNISSFHSTIEETCFAQRNELISFHATQAAKRSDIEEPDC